MKAEQGEPFKLVIVGHVDHGKSTLVGRLLADTGSLPEGKLEQVKEFCEKNGRPFEYAFLLDALKDEQGQGITIDTARCFFKTQKRDYLIFDAPGHIEFLKNMISGAARAEAAVLVIDADEGIQENSKRHAYMLSLLGIRQVIVCVNKMDLAAYKQDVFENIRKDYGAFLSKIGISPVDYLPVSAMKGDNLVKPSENMKWYKGKNLLEALDSLRKEPPLEDAPLRIPVQDVYRFTENNDRRRIIAGRVESGTLRKGDEIILLPSGKSTRVKSIEEFNRPAHHPEEKVSAGYSTGFTLEEQIYVRRGEIVAKKGEKLPEVASTFEANVFWMGRSPLVEGKEYKLKLATSETPFKVKEIISVLDTTSLKNEKGKKIARHAAGKCVIECLKPIAFDLAENLQNTSRFVIVEDYDIVGGGIIVAKIDGSEYVQEKRMREEHWDKSMVSFEERAIRYGQKPLFIMITGKSGIDKKSIAWHLEKKLFTLGKKTYFLGIRNLLRGLNRDITDKNSREHIRRLAEVANFMVDAGLIVIATASDLSHEDFNMLRSIVDETLIITVDTQEDFSDLNLDSELPPEENAERIIKYLKFKGLIFSL
ncbi:adenylyl-sulfate kinase [Candidatus Woesearchaeota archaeon]|nr:MAG: adenylyl-sulfate kinase [Candidatus Woesearchaeota archaeon]